MKKNCAVTMAIIGIVLVGLSLPSESFARPKRLTNGCTDEQIQSNFGNSCVDQMQQDLINNKPYTHVLLCNGGEKLCCTYDNATNQIQTCRKPAGTALMPGLRDSKLGISGAEIKSRGVEGDVKLQTIAASTSPHSRCRGSLIASQKPPA